jgi:hypothetical protein
MRLTVTPLLKAGTRIEITELIKAVVIASSCTRIKLRYWLTKGSYGRILLKEHVASPAQLANARQSPDDLIHLEYAAKLRRSGFEVRLVLSPESQEATPSPQSQALLKAVARAHDWREQLVSGHAQGLRSIAKRAGLDRDLCPPYLQVCIPRTGYRRGNSRRTPAPGFDTRKAKKEVADELG